MQEKNGESGVYVKVYLDVCCLCRPFDDQLIPRIRNESEAVIAILNRCSLDWELIWSSAITYEVAKIIDHDKKHYIGTFAAKTNINILVDLEDKKPVVLPVVPVGHCLPFESYARGKRDCQTNAG